MLELPPLLIDAACAELTSLRIPRREQVNALRELFTLFTKERSRLGLRSYWDQPRLRAAYLGYHVPLNAARARYVLSQVASRYARLAQLSKVIDLGGGPGTAAWASTEVNDYRLEGGSFARQG